MNNYEETNSKVLVFCGLREKETQTDDFIFENSKNICNACNSYISKNENSIIHLKCEHSFCHKCLKRLAKEQLKNEDLTKIFCPLCCNPLFEYEIEKVDPKIKKEIESRIFNQTHIKCPNCKEAFERIPDENETKDMHGHKIRQIALKCSKENKFTCTFCQTSFCEKCNSVPYHVGLTCQELKNFQNGIICRFCRNYPASGNSKDDPCLRVCWNSNCKKHMDESCTHLLDCGHPCCGLKDESSHFGCPICDENISICSICKKSSSKSPSVLMKCGHPVHKKCLVKYYKDIDLKGKLHFQRCEFDSECQCFPYHKCVKSTANKYLQIFKKIDEITQDQMEIQDTVNEKLYVNNPKKKKYYHNPLKYANDFFVFYICDKCKNPFYAGQVDDDLDDDDEHLCICCNKFPSIPINIPNDEVNPLSDEIKNEIIKKRKKCLSSRIIHLGVRNVVHATTMEAAQNIMKCQYLNKGSKGMFGPGIYFAATEDIAKWKCNSIKHKVDAFIHCNVDFGDALVLEKPHNTLTLKQLREYGCNSVFGRSGPNKKWEFVVYDEKRTHPIKIVPVKS